MEIKVKIKNNYGTQAIYPICDKAKAFARIAKTSTLTRETIKEVKELGYSITVVQPTVSL